MHIVHKTFNNATVFHSFYFSEFHKLLRFIWPWVHTIALCIDDVIALRIDDVIALRIDDVIALRIDDVIALRIDDVVTLHRDDVIALRIDDVSAMFVNLFLQTQQQKIIHLKYLENQFWFVCPHYGSI